MTALDVHQKEKMIDIMESYLESIRNVVPLQQDHGDILVLQNDIQVDFGVSIEFNGTLNGNLVLMGKSLLFSRFGETMFGMPLEGEMLQSFSGELGNMIAGGFATNLSQKEQHIDITAPFILTEPKTITGHSYGLHVPVGFKDNGNLDTFILFHK